MKAKIALFSKLLRELEAEIGMNDVDVLVLKKLIISIEAFKAKDIADFFNQYQELQSILYNTEPKYGILRYQLGELNKKIIEIVNKKKKSDVKKCKKKIINIIKKLITESKKQQRLILQNAEKINVEGKTILIHDQSHTVQNVLKHYKKMRKKFGVIIAEQEYEKTHSNIEFLHKHKIPFRVVPAYMLSHLHDEVDMVFFGGLTLKDTMVFVMSTGTHGIVTEFNLAKVPIYMFINTLKFSLWESQERIGVFMQHHKRKHAIKDIEYNRIKYSHDRVPTEFFKKVITNEGVMTPNQIEKLFTKRYFEHLDIQ